MRLPAPMDATYGTMQGPFYPESMEMLAAAIATIKPQAPVDLDQYWRNMPLGVLYHSGWGIDYLGDGYVPWRGYRLYAAGDAVVWLMLPKLRVTDEGAMVFERLPALYVEVGELSEAQLQAVAATLVAGFSNRLVA